MIYPSCYKTCKEAKIFWFVALIIFWVSLTLSWKTYANSSKRGLQLNRFGDKVSIYSEKAYRTNQGTYFEAGSGLFFW